jgi:D-serine deaminase-like pyridoxal phosphate-dependent protein
VFEDCIAENVATMSELLANLNFGLKDLCPHVKTHKSARVTRYLLDQGVSFFKSSLNEIDMLVECGVRRIFVAYPLLDADAVKIARHIKEHPEIRFYVQMARSEHVAILEKVSREFNVQWHYYIDVNIGMNRTGLAAEHALDFYQFLKAEPSFVFAGLHAYDGHIHQKAVSDRRRASTASMQRLQKTVNQFLEQGVIVPHCIIAGTPGFLPDAEYWSTHAVETEILLSPGTWIYFDSVSDEMMPNIFRYAALILAQVIDKPTPTTATLNCGHKRWAIDQGTVDVFSIPGMKVVATSEEHTVVTAPTAGQLNIGDYVFFAPRHVCSTVNLWEYSVVIDKNGDIEKSPVNGRNR